jgi:hypothetical protein
MHTPHKFTNKKFHKDIFVEISTVIEHESLPETHPSTHRHFIQTYLGLYCCSTLSVAVGSASSCSFAGTRCRHQKSAMACRYRGTTHSTGSHCDKTPQQLQHMCAVTHS